MWINKETESAPQPWHIRNSISPLESMFAAPCHSQGAYSRLKLSAKHPEVARFWFVRVLPNLACHLRASQRAKTTTDVKTPRLLPPASVDNVFAMPPEHLPFPTSLTLYTIAAILVFADEMVLFSSLCTPGSEAKTNITIPESTPVIACPPRPFPMFTHL